MKKNLVLILAGGSGSRLAVDKPKQFIILAGKTILEHTLDKFESHPGIDDIFIVTNGEYRQQTEDIIIRGGYLKISKVLNGGAIRQESSRIGVMAADPTIYEKILIHDAARPFVPAELISTILAKLDFYQAVNVGIPSTDTIIEIDAQHVVKRVPDRHLLRRVQTPQGFWLHTIQRAHQLALENNFLNATDDCSLILSFFSTPILVVEGHPQNIKITYPIDVQIASSFLES